jgi:lipopolysaccharide export system protein LptC
MDGTMALSHTAYSRLVGWLKIVLPLTALAILSTLFLLARTPDIERTIPYAEVDVDALAREPRISAPDYSGVATDGTALQVSATTALPDPTNPARFTADELAARIDTTDGGSIRLRSLTGEVDTEAGTASLSGDVVIETPTGYAIRTDGFTVRLDATQSESLGPVDVTTPFGHLSAGRFALVRTAEDGQSHVLVFSGGVNLIYDPRD